MVKSNNSKDKKVVEVLSKELEHFNHLIKGHQGFLKRLQDYKSTAFSNRLI